MSESTLPEKLHTTALVEVVADQGIKCVCLCIGALDRGARTLGLVVRLHHKARRHGLARKCLKLLAVLVVHDEALPILEGLSATPMHLVVTPSSFIELAVISLEDALSVSDALLVFALVLVAAQVEGDSEAIPGSLVEHPLVAEPVLEEHASYPMHLAAGIDLAIVDIAVVDALNSFNTFNYTASNKGELTLLLQVWIEYLI